VLFSILLAACGDDDDAGDDVASPTIEAVETETETEKATAGETSTSAATVEATATTSATTLPSTVSPTTDDSEPTEPAAAGSPTEGTTNPTVETGSPTASALTEDEQALIDVLLSPSDLPNEWIEQSRSVPEDSDDLGFCNSGDFPRKDEQIAQVEVEMQSSDSASSLLQNLTEFEEDVAIEAMTFVRDAYSCTEFTDDDGTVISVAPADIDELGDETFGVTVSFQFADESDIQTDFIFVRVAGLISIVTVLELNNYDPARTFQVAEIAVDKMRTALGQTIGLESEQEALIGALISQNDLPQGWNVLSPAAPTDPEGWTGLCDASVNPDASNSVARVSVDFYEGPADTDATVQQVITAYPSGGGEAAMAYERDSVDCTEWTTGDVTIGLSPADYAANADSIFAVTYAFDDPDAGSVAGNWIALQVGDLVANIIYTDPEGVDPELVQNVIDTAVERMKAAIT